MFRMILSGQTGPMAIPACLAMEMLALLIIVSPIHTLLAPLDARVRKSRVISPVRLLPHCCRRSSSICGAPVRCGSMLLCFDYSNTIASWRVNLPPKWVDVVDRCEEHMDSLDKNCEALVSLHTKRLMVRIKTQCLRQHNYR